MAQLLDTSDHHVINCKHWSDCKIPRGGCCALGLYGGKPSEGTCKKACKKRDPVGVDEPDPPKPSFVAKAVSYVKAEVSLLTQFISEEDVQRRLAACRECPKLQASAVEGEVGWCKACGCGKNRRAELTVKARMPASNCPLNKWP